MTEQATDTEIVKKVMDHAKKQFQLHKYDDCLRLYTRAISYTRSLDQSTIARLRVHHGLAARPSYVDPEEPIYHPKLATLLDNRAAVLEKLKKAKDALADAKEMILVEPYNARGYLRAGKLLQLQKDYQKSHRIYERGIRTIQLGKTKYKLKINQHLLDNLIDQKSLVEVTLSQKTTKGKDTPSAEIPKKGRLIPIPTDGILPTKRQKLKETTAALIDPFTLLPAELIFTIFNNLPLQKVLQCRQVSKLWDHVITKLPFFNNLSLRSYTGSKDIHNCLQLVLNSKLHSTFKSINRLQIHSIRITDEKQILNHLLIKSPISLSGTLEINFMDVDMQLFTDILQASPHARELLSHLQTLKLKCVFTPRLEDQLLSLLPSLQSLTLIPAPYKKVPALPKSYSPPVDIFSNLKSLVLIGDISKKYPSIPFHHFFTVEGAGQLPNLNSFILVGYDLTELNSQNGNYNFLQHFPHLDSLIFENNKSFNLRMLLKSHDLLQLPKLKRFALREREIRYVEGLQIYDTIYLSNVFAGIRHLDLTGSSISFQGLHKLLTVCGSNLTHLYIGLCQNLRFKRGPFALGIPEGGFFEFEEFVRLCPLLESLYLNQATDFGDYSLGEMANVIKSRDGLRLLKVLDLSFNSTMSGYKLLDLLKVKTLDKLILHGVAIETATLNLMEKRYAKRVESKLDRQYWKEFGVNSYNPF